MYPLATSVEVRSSGPGPIVAIGIAKAGAQLQAVHMHPGSGVHLPHGEARAGGGRAGQSGLSRCGARPWNTRYGPRRAFASP